MFSFAWFWTLYLENYTVYILLLRVIWIVSSFELFWARMLWTSCLPMCSRTYSWGKLVEVACAFNSLDNAKLFPKVLVPIYILIHSVWEFLMLHDRSNQYLVVEEYFTVASMSTSLKTDEVRHFHLVGQLHILFRDFFHSFFSQTVYEIYIFLTYKLSQEVWKYSSGERMDK